jgi:4-amino-4-deoxy-L-arabinose transferase-like glycosyltransferase
LVVRLAVIAADSGYFPAHDAFDYVRHATSIAAGDGYPESRYALDGGPSALRPPAYPYLLGTVYAVSGDSETAGRVAGAVLGALAVLLLFLVVRRIWGRRVALIAATLSAVFPPLVSIDVQLLAEPLFIALELAAVLCVLEFRRSGGELRWAAAAGALCGLGALTRNPGPMLLLPIALGIATARPILSRRGLAAPAVVVAVAALVVAPWTLRNAVDFGRLAPVTTSSGFALAGTYNETSLRDDAHPGAWRTPVNVPSTSSLFLTHGVDEGTVDATLRRDALRFAREHPGYAIKATAWNLLRLFELEGGSVIGRNGKPLDQRGIGSGTPAAERIGLAIAAALALIGIAVIVRTRSRAGPGAGRIPSGPVFLWLVPCLAVLVSAPVAGLPRYRLPADPFLMLLAAIAITSLTAKARARAGRLP